MSDRFDLDPRCTCHHRMTSHGVVGVPGAPTTFTSACLINGCPCTHFAIEEPLVEEARAAILTAALLPDGT